MNLWALVIFVVVVPMIIAITCCRTQETHVNISGYEHKTGVAKIEGAPAAADEPLAPPIPSVETRSEQ